MQRFVSLCRPAFLLLGLSLLQAGCDGYEANLYLTPPHVQTPGWSVTRIIIPIQGNEDVVAIVESVSKEMGLEQVPRHDYRWVVQTFGDNGLTVTLKWNPAGYWVVNLLDWQTVTRSELSKEIEQKIREALKPES